MTAHVPNERLHSAASLIATGLLAISLAGCGGLPSNKTPMEDVIVAAKRSLTQAGEQALFEECVRYGELGETFNLYRIDKVTLKSSTSAGTNREAGGGAIVTGSAPSPIFPGVTANVSTKLTASNSHSGELSIELSPIDDDIHDKIEEIFAKYCSRSPPMYEEPIYKVADEGRQLECTKYHFCFRLERDTKEDVSYAYLRDRRRFREMLAKIEAVQPTSTEPKKPST